MANAPYEIPTEMRDFAEKSVDQARKAFEGFMGAAHKAAGSVDASAHSVTANAKDMGVKAMSYAEQNITAAFELAQKMVRAKDVQEVLKLQGDYAKAQMSAIQTQAKELGSIVQTAAASVTKKTPL